MVHFSNLATPSRLTDLRASAQDERCRPGVAVTQTMKAERGRQRTKRGADPLREDHSWSERHGSKQQLSAARFASPSFFCLRNRCSRAATLRYATSRTTRAFLCSAARRVARMVHFSNLALPSRMNELRAERR